MRYPKFLTNLILCSLISSGFAQENSDIGRKAEAYRNLINYIPTNLRSSSQMIRKDSTQEPINNIQTLWTYHSLVHSSFDRKLMDETIQQVAQSLFADGKKILLSTVGGYLGCPDKSVDTIQIQGEKILQLPLCSSCHDSVHNQRFVQAFNMEMYELMQIDPPTEETKLFYGVYKGFDENKRPLKLILKEDRSFQFWKYPELGHGSDLTDGFWKHRNDTLILNSRTLKGMDSIAVALQSGRWVEFKNVKWILKRTKLKSLDRKKWRLKKE